MAPEPLISLEELDPTLLDAAEQDMLRKALKSLRVYVILALVAVVILVAIGIAIVISQNIAYHDQVINNSQVTHSLLHQLQATLAQDKCEIIHGQNYPCPLPK
jgi:type IV secretory pathway component VirB8